MEPESTPFLCNIVQPSKRNITLGVSLAFPSPKTPKTIEPSLVSDIEESQPKQGKRPRYSLFPKPIVPRSDIDVSSVLQTPPINRIRRSEAVTGSCNRPASILKDKMNRFMNNSLFNSSQTTVVSDAHLSDEEVEVADTSSKHLRFSLPQAISTSTSESEPMDTMDVSDKDTPKSVVEEKREEEFLSFVEDSDEGGSPVRDIPFSTTCYDMDITNVAPISAHYSAELTSKVEGKLEKNTNAGAETKVVMEVDAKGKTEADAKVEADANVEAGSDAEENAEAQGDIDMSAEADSDAEVHMDTDKEEVSLIPLL